MVPPSGRESVLAMLQALDPELKSATVDLARTFDGRFVGRTG
jgi:NitT/TauT family transport system substrate-binding protein